LNSDPLSIELTAEFRTRKDTNMHTDQHGTKHLRSNEAF
jgi:hypothetical protein